MTPLLKEIKELRKFLSFKLFLMTTETFVLRILFFLVTLEKYLSRICSIPEFYVMKPQTLLVKREGQLISSLILVRNTAKC